MLLLKLSLSKIHIWTYERAVIHIHRLTNKHSNANKVQYHLPLNGEATFWLLQCTVHQTIKRNKILNEYKTNPKPGVPLLLARCPLGKPLFHPWKYLQ